mgnify:CR=1 FL=1
MKKSIIKGTGKFVPPNVITNHDLEKIMDTSDEWIRQRTGIEQRYWIDQEGETGSSDLGVEAAKQALEQAGWTAEDLDFIIFATLSPDIMFPGGGCLMAAKLGLNSTPALDIRQQCTRRNGTARFCVCNRTDIVRLLQYICDQYVPAVQESWQVERLCVR